MGNQAEAPVLKGPRTPVQDRSKARVARILQATEEIVLEDGWGAATAYAIAKRAGVPPAGVYHFFPDRFTIYATLLEHYFADFGDQMAESVAVADPRRWEELVDIVLNTFVNFFRDNDCARILALGGTGAHEMRWSSTRNSDGMAMLLHRLFENYFVMPNDPELAERFRVAVYMASAGFSHAVRIGDPMDERAVEETKTAMKAYVSTWIGKDVRRKEKQTA
ncbi:MAG: TetR/AcrR family transcriptional regulator [Proteobacteria bacterium]|nr:TetR/AcrR family transcriptional regulator [Pseudomonadota bacterium]